MNRTLLSAAFAVTLTAPAFANDTVSLKTIGITLAVEIAQSAVAACSSDGYNVTASVVDRSGAPLALVRAESAGPHTANAATAKAFTSSSSRNPTSAMADAVRNNPVAAGLVDIPGFLVLAGGVPITAGKDTIGAIGVAGAPGGNLDEACANKAIVKFERASEVAVYCRPEQRALGGTIHIPWPRDRR